MDDGCSAVGGRRIFTRMSLLRLGTSLALSQLEIPGLRLEIHNTLATEMSPENRVDHQVTLQASGLAAIEVLDGPSHQRHMLASGAFCLAPSGSARRVRWTVPRALYIVGLSAEWVRKLAEETSSRLPELRSEVGVRDDHVEWLVRALVEEYRNGNPTGPIYAEMLVNALAIRLVSRHGSNSDSGEAKYRGGLAAAKLRLVLERMHADLSNPPQLTELAKLAGLSVDHFVRAFRSSVGEPPHRYLLKERIRKAENLLASTSKSISEIALTLGFADQSHFQTMFRRIAGTTPKRYRSSASDPSAVAHR